MNKEILESQWTQIREILREKFNNLSEEDIRQINGRYDQLVTKLEQKYGFSRSEAEERIRSWNFDRFANPKSSFNRETPAQEIKADTSPFKWLLAIGIPLLLLGSYFLADRAPEVASTPAVTQEQLLTETPADRSISSGLRTALLSQSQQNLSLALQNVQISTRDGVVTLSGFVPTPGIRDFIGSAAQNYAGVTKVVNNIEVR